MHLFLATQGIKHMQDLFVSGMQGQAFPWKRKNLKTGQEEILFVQGALRPITLWSYVFPEECLGEVLEMLKLNDEHIKNATDGIGNRMLRKALDIEPVPLGVKRDKSNITVGNNIINNFHLVSDAGMDIRPIGIKYDKKGKIDFPNGESYEQEQL